MRRTYNLRRKRQNLALYQRALEEKRRPTPHLPVEIFVEVSNRCNIRCIMCARPEEMGIETGDISLDHINGISELFSGSLMLHAYGFGEPFMNPHFFHLLEKAKRQFAYVDFFTNGMALNPQKSEHLVELGVDRITFSVDGATPSTFETLRAGARFDTVAGNMHSLHEEKLRQGSEIPKIDINFIAMQSNFRELPQLAEFAGEMGVAHLNVKPLVTYAYKPELHQLRRTYSPEQDDEILDQTAQLCVQKGISLDIDPYRSTGLVHDTSRNQKLKEGSKRPVCFQPWKTMYVTWSGQIKTCCFAHGPILGSLNDDSAGDIWFGSAYETLRRQIAEGNYPEDCSHCLQFALMPIRDDAEDIFGLISQGLGRLKRSVVMSPG